MKTIDMEIGLMNYFNIAKHLIVPNVTSMSGLVRFETDLLVLTKSGYATGIEIKVSKSDLKKDLQKNHIKHLDTNWKSWSKEDCKEFYYKNYKYFYYAVPEELEEEALKQIPDFCGLLVAREIKSDFGDLISFHNSKGRGATELYRTKWSPEMQFQLARLGAMRISGLKKKFQVKCK